MMAHQQAEPGQRIEKDLLGTLAVAEHCYYGIQTQRALDNFDLSGIPISHFPELVTALAMVKCASAQANNDFGLLDDEKTEAIEKACSEIISGRWHEQFVVDLIQGGAGTSTNMNANEVIANRALELLGYERGDYDRLHPNNDVNCSQSTNDVYPTAVRLALIFTCRKFNGAIATLCAAMNEKAQEFQDVLKMGRTQLQDAVPMTLGQEFQAFAVTLAEDISRIDEIAHLLSEVNLGGTAIGTGINTPRGYSEIAVDRLSRVAGLPMTAASNLVEATSDMGAFVLLSGMLKRVAVKLSKICNDLRLLSSGPRTGFNEIALPAMQPGSSIMPGKVNPVIPEAVNQVAYQVIGNDLAVTMAAEAGQLQLNAMEPLITCKLLESMQILSKAMDMLGQRCISGIIANRGQCERYVHGSIGIVTAVNPYIGYENATRIARRALQEERSVVELILEEGLLCEAELERILSPEAMLNPGGAPVAQQA